jgi:hypothetical protein
VTATSHSLLFNVRHMQINFEQIEGKYACFRPPNNGIVSIIKYNCEVCGLLLPHGSVRSISRTGIRTLWRRIEVSIIATENNEGGV